MSTLMLYNILWVAVIPMKHPLNTLYDVRGSRCFMFFHWKTKYLSFNNLLKSAIITEKFVCDSLWIGLGILCTCIFCSANHLFAIKFLFFAFLAKLLMFSRKLEKWSCKWCKSAVKQLVVQFLGKNLTI